MFGIRLTRAVTLLAAVVLPAGCLHDLPADPASVVDHRSHLGEPRELLPEPNGAPRNEGAPAEVTTVLSKECPPRPISLAECIALALENGRTGELFDRGRGTNIGV